jgi:hypothetical protein
MMIRLTFVLSCPTSAWIYDEPKLRHGLHMPLYSLVHWIERSVCRLCSLIKDPQVNI